MQVALIRCYQNGGSEFGPAHCPSERKVGVAVVEVGVEGGAGVT